MTIFLHPYDPDFDGDPVIPSPAVTYILAQMRFEPYGTGQYCNKKLQCYIRIYEQDTPADIAERIFKEGQYKNAESIRTLLGV